MFDFSNLHIKIHHDTSSKWKRVQQQSCSPLCYLSKTSKIMAFGSFLSDLRMVTLHGLFWQLLNSIFKYLCMASCYDLSMFCARIWTQCNHHLGLNACPCTHAHKLLNLAKFSKGVESNPHAINTCPC